MRGKRLWDGAEIKAWGRVVFDNCLNNDEANKFEHELIKMA